MSLIISTAAQPLSWDELPAALITRYPYTDGCYDPYTQGRFYAAFGDLYLNITAFEAVSPMYSGASEKELAAPARAASQFSGGRIPAELFTRFPILLDSITAFALNPDPKQNRILLVLLNSAGDRLLLLKDGKSVEEVSLSDEEQSGMEFSTVHGEDNQGVYWSCRFRLSARLIGRLFPETDGFSLPKGCAERQMKGNFYKTLYGGDPMREQIHFGSYFEPHSPDIFDEESLGSILLADF